MLYRPAEEPNPDVWGWNVEHKVFAEADVDVALADGWARHPLDASNIVPSDPDQIDTFKPADPEATENAGNSKRKGRPPKEA